HLPAHPRGTCSRSFPVREEPLGLNGDVYCDFSEEAIRRLAQCLHQALIYARVSSKKSQTFSHANQAQAPGAAHHIKPLPVVANSQGQTIGCPVNRKIKVS